MNKALLIFQLTKNEFDVSFWHDSNLVATYENITQSSQERLQALVLDPTLEVEILFRQQLEILIERN